MPDSCCAVGCMNKRIKGDKSLSFYRIPFGNTEESNNRRVLWLQALKRENWSTSMIDNARLCSKHFISGKKSYNPNFPDYVPSVFLYRQQSFSKKHQSIERFERSCKRTKKKY
ncbi:peroxynitrite isomerase THAP4-like [Hydra vulgaris]|uniref:Peroxynitrite isomerase THAP4-like n=1 Tax=Hydra vulgaris TaxID=6087 RepID=A0ABM4CAN6_HYDVU